MYIFKLQYFIIIFLTVFDIKKNAVLVKTGTYQPQTFDWYCI